MRLKKEIETCGNCKDFPCSKSFFCVSCALLPIEKLKEIDKKLKNMPANNDLKTRNKHAKKLITDIADTLNIDLKLKK